MLCDEIVSPRDLSGERRQPCFAALDDERQPSENLTGNRASCGSPAATCPVSPTLTFKKRAQAYRTHDIKFIKYKKAKRKPPEPHMLGGCCQHFDIYSFRLLSCTCVVFIYEKYESYYVMLFHNLLLKTERDTVTMRAWRSTGVHSSTLNGCTLIW